MATGPARLASYAVTHSDSEMQANEPSVSDSPKSLDPPRSITDDDDEEEEEGHDGAAAYPVVMPEPDDDLQQESELRFDSF